MRRDPFAAVMPPGRGSGRPDPVPAEPEPDSLIPLHPDVDAVDAAIQHVQQQLAQQQTAQQQAAPLGIHGGLPTQQLGAILKQQYAPAVLNQLNQQSSLLTALPIGPSGAAAPNVQGQNANAAMFPVFHADSITYNPPSEDGDA